MKDNVKEPEEETLDLTLEEKETVEKEEVKEKTVPLEALQEERRKRQELERRMSEMEASQKAKPSTSDISNPDLEQAVAQLDPYLRRRGYLTREEFEAEKSADDYSKEMKDLTEKYSGKDGRPAFDAYAVSEYGKRNRIYNLEVAYEQLHKKELTDWEAKSKGGDQDDMPETERPGTSGYRNAGNTPMLTRENLARKLNSPGGKEWWEKNREKVMAAIARGEIT